MRVMALFRDLSIRRSLTLVTMLASSAALLAASAAFIGYDVVAFRQGMARRLETIADILTYNGASALVFRDQEAAAQTLAALKATRHVTRAAIHTPDGQLFASYQRSGMAQLPPQSTAPVLLPGHRFERNRLVVVRLIEWDGAVIGRLLVEADLGEIEERLRSYAGIVALVSLASLLVSLVVASRLQRGISGPILHLADTARVVSNAKDYSVRASGEGEGELGLLTRTFNEMLAEIQKRDLELGEARADLERRVEARTSDLKRTQEQISLLNESLERRAQELEVANKELEAFSYSVSHDLRAPLRAIDGFSQALIEDYAERLDAQGNAHLQRVRAGAQRMAQLIDDLLKLSRISRAELNPVPLDVSALARSVVEEVKPPKHERLATIHVQEGLKGEADPRLLRVAFENLFANAWKFTSKKPAARIEFGAMQDGGRPVYFVRDNGAGFDMAYAGKLFGAFQRLHHARDFEGTGIGLATVSRVIHRHGGRIWAEGALDQGATFFFTLGEPGAGQAEA